MTDALQTIMNRRSVRSFTGAPVPKDKLVAALQAAMAAPSGRNLKPWHFLVVTEPAAIHALCQAHPHATFGTKAGAVVLPFGRKAEHKWFDQDMAAATENLLIAVANLGLGATWCGMDDARQPTVRNLVGLPEDEFVFALIPIGVPVETPPARTQYDASRVYWETYSARTSA